MSKISELSDGGVIQGGDTLIAVRSGGNVKVTYGGSTTANIDGGTIDGTVIGGTTPAAVTTSSLVATTADINAGTIDGTVIGGSSAAAGSFTTISASGEIAANGGVAFGDNDKATFGASNDLQIFHDGSNSYITEFGTGNLNIRGQANINFESSNGSETFATFALNGASTLYYDNATKLATTATGIDVTGTATMDGLTVDGGNTIRLNASSGDDFLTIEQGTSDAKISANSTAGNANLQFFTTASGVVKQRVDIATNGDLSLFEDTGTTAKFFWDASQELLLIGEDSSNRIGTGANLALGDIDGGLLSIGSTKLNDFNAGDIMGSIEFRNVDGSVAEKTKAKIVAVDDASTGASAYPLGVALAFSTISAGTLAERVRITGSGSVGIGTSSPAAKLEIGGAGEGIILASPDGTRYEITVANGGTLTVTAV